VTWPPFIERTHPLAEDVVQARAEFARINGKNGKVLEPLIGAHLMAYDAARTELNDAHRYIAEQSDLALDGRTREAGIWLVAGRCIGLAHASHTLASNWYVVEVIPVLRSLHEATRLLGVFGMPDAQDLVKRWLEDRNVSRGDIMAAHRRREERVRLEMLKSGEPIPGTTVDYAEKQYGRWSEFAHNRRPHLLRQVAIPDRLMAVGPHPEWRARAVTVDHFGWYLIEFVSAGGLALASIGRPEWRDRFQASYGSLLDLKSKIPLMDIAEGKVNVGGPGDAVEQSDFE
jgi:hypothetical protein